MLRVRNINVFEFIDPLVFIFLGKMLFGWTAFICFGLLGVGFVEGKVTYIFAEFPYKESSKNVSSRLQPAFNKLFNYF